VVENPDAFDDSSQGFCGGLVRPNTMICAALPFHVKSWTGFERLPFNGACPMRNRLTTSPKSPPFWGTAFCVFTSESPVKICRRHAIVRSNVSGILGVMWPVKLRFPDHERLGFIAVSRLKGRVRTGFEGEVAGII